MQITENGEAYFLAQQKKKTYFAMCRVTVLLFVFTVLSATAGSFVSYVLTEFYVPVEYVIVKILMLFGSEKQFALSVAKNFLFSTAFHEAVSMFTSLLTMVLPVFVFARITKMTGDECFNVSGKTVRFLPLMFCVCQLVTMTASVFSQSVYGFLVPAGAGAGSVSGMGAELDTIGLIMRVLNVCIFVPVVEEFVFRGVMFSYLKKYGLSFAVIASAVLFGIAHKSPVQSVYAFVFGVLAAFLAAVTGNIKTGIILHALNNFITVMTEYLSINMDPILFNIIYAFYMCIVLAASFFGLYRVIIADDMFGKFRECAKINDEGIVCFAGMRQIMTVPLIIYVADYASKIVMGVLAQ